MTPRGSAFGGPGLVAVLVLRWLLPLVALAVVIDAVRRPAWHFAPGARGARVRVGWIAPQVVFAVLLVAGYALPQNDALDLAVVAAIPAVVIIAVAYLLRVVFPSHERREERAARDPKLDCEPD